MLTAFLGCSTSDSDSGDDFGTYEAIVFGRVATPSAAALARTSFVLSAHFDDCESEPVSQGLVTTAGDGTYEKRVRDFTPETVVCLSAAVAPSEGAPADTFFLSPTLQLRPAPPYDSVRADFVLAP